MPVNLKGRSLLTLKDFTPDEIRYLLNLAADLKAKSVPVFPVICLQARTSFFFSKKLPPAPAAHSRLPRLTKAHM